MTKLELEEIVEIMSNSENCRIHCIETDGDDWTGTVDVFESELENEDDERQGASICVKRDDGLNAIVYDSDIKFIEIL